MSKKLKRCNICDKAFEISWPTVWNRFDKWIAEQNFKLTRLSDDHQMVHKIIVGLVYENACLAKFDHRLDDGYGWVEIWKEYNKFLSTVKTSDPLSNRLDCHENLRYNLQKIVEKHLGGVNQ